MGKKDRCKKCGQPISYCICDSAYFNEKDRLMDRILRKRRWYNPKEKEK